MASTFSFDKINHIITVAAPDTEITVQELVNACREWEDEQEAMDVIHVIDAAGKEDLGGGVSVGITVTLKDWKVKFEDRAGPDWVLCNIRGGNLVAVDQIGDSMNPIEPAAYVTVSLTASSSATLRELTTIQQSAFNNGVMIDILNGTAGTDFPAGTGEQPVNNLADAKTIAQARGFSILYIIGNITFSATDDIDGFEIRGQNTMHTKVTVEAGCSTEGTQFDECTLEGTLDGDVEVRKCDIEDLTSFEGEIYDSCLEGTIVLSGSLTVNFANCISGIAGTLTPTIDMGGSGRDLGMRGYSGGIKIINLTGNNRISLDFLSGQAIIDSTVTNGSIIVRGVAKLTDNSGGSAVVDKTNLVNPFTVADQALDEILSEHSIVGSVGEALDIIRKIETNRWKIINNQFIIYDDDGVSPIYTFNLKNKAGDPTETEPYERVPV